MTASVAWLVTTLFMAKPVMIGYEVVPEQIL